MALHYTRPKDTGTDKDVPAEEFVKKMLESKRTTDERPHVFNTESAQ